MKYIENYSYLMPYGVSISGFKVAEERTTAELKDIVRDSKVLYPFRAVMLYLDETYPGSVYALLVGVLAGSGEVAYCNAQAAGGASFPSNNDLVDSIPTPTPTPQETEPQPEPKSIIAGSFVAVIAVVAAGLLVYFKKRRMKSGDKK